MNRRLELQRLFENILGSRNVYFQPPEDIKMRYPAIVYSIDDIEHKHANNKPYIRSPNYMATLIDFDPDSEFVEKLDSLPMCSFDRSYTSDNLHHWVYNIFY